MKRKVLSIALAVCLLLSVTAVFTPVFASAANEGGWTNWDITWDNGVSHIEWAAVPGASSYTIAFAGAHLGNFVNIGTTGGTSFDWTTTNPKYENYFRVTPNNGAEPIMISLEGKIFGPNCYFYDSKYHSGAAASTEVNFFARHQLDGVPGGYGMNWSEMSPRRFALMFKPGAYDDNHGGVVFDVGYNTSVYGLGRLPTDTTVSSVWCKPCVGGGWSGTSTQVFWRSIENIQVVSASNNPASTGDGFRWAVSQAAPARRIDVASGATGDWDYSGNSGGFIADSKFHYGAGSVSGQQYYYRNDDFAVTPAGYNWHTFFEGCTGAANPDAGEGYGSGGLASYITNLPTVEKIREKPFIYLDGGEYKVFVPGWRDNASGISWGAGKDNGGMGVGTSLDLLSDFFIAYPNNTSEEINDALDSGLNLLLTPGHYSLDQPIHVTNEDTVVLGIGYATIAVSTENKWGAMLVEDVDGVIVAGVFFEARHESVYLLRVGEEEHSDEDHQANPTILSDCFFRFGGAYAENSKVEVGLQIFSNDTIVDHTWLWRADHGVGGVGWDVNSCDYGLWVSGDRVTTHGQFNEHFKKYSLYWEGDYGKVFFLQNETPYDVIYQDRYMSHKGTVTGYAQLKVSNKVDNFYGVGLGSYPCYFVDRGAVTATNAYEVPHKPGVKLENMAIVNLAGANGTRYAVNNWSANNQAFYHHVKRYPAANGTYPGTEPIDHEDDPDFITPSYSVDWGLDFPFTYEGPSVKYALTNLVKGVAKALPDTDYTNTLTTGTGSNFGFYVPNAIQIVMNGAQTGVVLTEGVDYTYTPSADRLSATFTIKGELLGEANYDADNKVQFVVTAAAEDARVFIDYSGLSHISSNGPAVLYNGTTGLEITLKADNGYKMPTSISVTGAAYTYKVSIDGRSAMLTIPSITQDVTVSGSALDFTAGITYNLSGMMPMADAPKIATKDGPVGIPLQVAGSTFTMPATVKVDMVGKGTLVEGTDYTYEAAGLSGIINIFMVTGDITVTAAASGTPGLPENGRQIYLVAYRNGKIVQATGNDSAMKANLEAVPADTKNIAFTVVNANNTTYLRTAAGRSMTLTSWSYGGWAVNLQETGMRPAPQWETLTLEAQADGTMKIYRAATATGDVDATHPYTGYKVWAEVQSDDSLTVAFLPPDQTSSDNCKFYWFYADEQIPVPVDKSLLLGAINLFGSLTSTDWTADSWNIAVLTAAAGQSVYNDANATQDNVDNATATLMGALNALVPAGTVEPARKEIMISQTTAYAFPDTVEGYATSPSKSFTVYNIGNQPTGALNITLSDDEAFVLTAGIANIATGAAADFTIAPVAGLAPGTYSATVSVSGADITARSFSVSFTVIPTTKITTATLPDATATKAYSETLKAIGVEPIRWSLVDGNLPLGLTLSADGKISGTPLEVGAATFTVSATAATSLVPSVTQVLTLTVGENLTKFTPMNDGTYAVYSGTASAATVLDRPGKLYYNTGNSTIYFIRKMSEGIGSVVLDGTADAALINLFGRIANYTNTITVKNGIVVTLDLNSGPNANTDFTTGDCFSAEMDVIISHSNNGGTTYGFQKTPNHQMRNLLIRREAGNVNTKTITMKDLIIDRGDYVFTGGDLGNTGGGTVNASQIACYNSTGNRVVTVGGTSCDFNAAGKQGNFQSTEVNYGTLDDYFKNDDMGKTIAQLYIVDYKNAVGGLAQGDQYVARYGTLNANVGTGATNLSITMGLLPFSTSAVTSAGYNRVRVLASSEYTYDPATGELEVPNVTGHVTITSNGTATFDIAPTIMTASLIDGFLSTAYSDTLTAVGNPSNFTWTVTEGDLPAGLNLNASTGAITGTPTEAGDFSFTVTVSNGVSPNASKELTIAVHPQGWTKFTPMNGGTYAIATGTSANPTLDRPGKLYFNTASQLITFWRSKDEPKGTVQLSGADPALVRLLTLIGNYTNTITVKDGKVVTVDINSGPAAGFKFGAAGVGGNAFTTDMDVLISFHHGNLPSANGGVITTEGLGQNTHNPKSLIITKEAGPVDPKQMKMEQDLVIERDLSVGPYTWAAGNSQDGLAATGSYNWVSGYQMSANRNVTVTGTTNTAGTAYGTKAYMADLNDYFTNDARGQAVALNYIVDYTNAAGGNATGDQYVLRGKTLTANVGMNATNLKVAMGLEPFVADAKSQTAPNHTGGNSTNVRTRELAPSEYTYDPATGALSVPNVTGYVTITSNGTMGSVVVPVVKTALKAQLDRFAPLLQADWTGVTWGPAAAAAAAGQLVYDNDDADQAAVDAATLALKNAIDALDPFVPPAGYVTDIVYNGPAVLNYPASYTLGNYITIVPSDAPIKDVTWSIRSGVGVNLTNPATGAITFGATNPGANIVMRATIVGGGEDGADFYKDFTIPTFAAVTGITGVPEAASIHVPLILAPTVNPSYASNKTIEWSIKDAGTTGATLSGSTLTTPSVGTVVITATIKNGITNGTADFVRDFTINVVDDLVPVTDISYTGALTMGVAANLNLGSNATVVPSNATSKNIIWSIVSSTSAGSVINSTTGVVTTGADGIGIIQVRATILNGKGPGEDFTKDFFIYVGMPAVDKTALKTQLDRFADYTASEWTTATWAVAAAAAVAGQGVYDDGFALQEAVDAAALALKNAIDALEPNAPEYYLGLKAYQDPAFTLKVGQKMVLGLDTNIDYSDLVFTYSSAYLKIDQATGTITGVKSGVAVITITTKVDPSLKLTLIAQIG